LDFAKSADFLDMKVFVAALPSVNRATLRADGDKGTAAEVLGDIFHAWSGSVALMRAEGIPTVLVSHGTVNGCVTESKQAMVSPDHEFTTGQLFSAGTSAVMLGHIHAHQAWEKDGRRIAYPGSITKLIYGHAAKTGYLLWDVTPDSATFELVETPSRQLIEIDFNVPPDMAELHRRLATCRDAYVRLRYSVDEEHRHIVDTAGIKAALTGAGVAEFKIEPHINPVQRSRAAGINATTSLSEKLKRWCELTGTDPAPLLPRLEALLAGQQPGAALTGSPRSIAA
jgi:exonuclease SbcD